MEDAYSIIATRHKYPDSASYHRLLEFLMNPLQARIVAELPASAEELSRRLGLSSQETTTALDDLLRRAMIYPKENSQPPIYKSWAVPDMLFYTVCAYNPDTPQGKKVIELWREFYKDWYPKLAETFAAKPMPEERVVPAYKAIKDTSVLHACEDVRELIKAAKVIAIVDCPCRVVVQKCHGALDTCFMFDVMADIFIPQGIARHITVEEALRLTDKAEDEGQVHTWINSNYMHNRFMCNCCDDCCVVWAPLTQHGISVGKRLAKSRFQTEVNSTKCAGDCPDCIDRCLFNAIEIRMVPGSSKPRAVIDTEKCYGCGLCVLKCQPEALSMKLVRPLEHIPGLAPV